MVTYVDPDAQRLAAWADRPSIVTSPEDRRALLRAAAALEREAAQKPPPPKVKR